MGPHTLLLRQWSRTRLYRSPRSSLSETILATVTAVALRSTYVRRSENGPLELLWLFYFAKECNGFPFFGHRCCADQPPLVPKQVIWCAFYHTCPSSSCQLRAGKCQPTLQQGITHYRGWCPNTPSPPTRQG